MSDVAEFLRARYDKARESAHSARRSIPSPFDGHEVEFTYGIGEPAQLLVDGHPYPQEKYLEIATEPAPDSGALAEVDGWGMDPLTPVYDARDHYAMAADMCRRTAVENRWRERVARRLHIPWP